MPITPELLKDYKSPEDMFGDDGLLQQLCESVVEISYEESTTYELQ